ncbi:hypothetical protein M758_7G023900 [Ceratodon purpureus]|uniref:Uncharacterized protein n=1 Tax=Ceratodon purpureus TaxID=3225 RepID=A0A8T0H5G8_CERPU|nr:hypothetical protein KC19_N042200 [Ceratodon purpureus]KAG0565937.1 hypothetical protein KC19_7G024900 [Ceratodon purpureus]KAG0609920.1 hypothetical protein M758_7G023900 [Ceratodon purpureus]
MGSSLCFFCRISCLLSSSFSCFNCNPPLPIQIAIVSVSPICCQLYIVILVYCMRSPS